MARDAKINSKEAAIALAWVLMSCEEWRVLCSGNTAVPASAAIDEADKVTPTEERLRSLSS